MVQNRFGGAHAIVIGASMAGLLAARVLTDHFDQVTVLERDQLPDHPDFRKGVPQAHHIHALLARGAQIMEQFFPGVFHELVEQGCVKVDQAKDFRVNQYGLWKDRYESAFNVHSLSRPLLEWAIRRRLTALPNVAILDEATVNSLITTSDQSTVTGVQITRGGAGQSLTADLVVDAGGRGTRTPQWLQEKGYGEVPVSTLKVDLAYATRIFKAREGVDWKGLAAVAEAPATRSGTILPMEGNRWIATVWGYFGDHPPTDPAGWLEFTRGLPVPDLYEALRDAEPLTPVTLFKFPGHLRRHYERMDRFPEGLAVLGDAVCSFNPIYGQGMTTGALGAVELETCLASQEKGRIVGFSGRFRQRLARVVDAPWELATSSDMGYPQAEGKRPLATRVVSRFVKKMLDLSAVDREINDRFLPVQHMLKPPTYLFSPRMIFRVLTSPAPRTGT